MANTRASRPTRAVYLRRRAGVSAALTTLLIAAVAAIVPLAGPGGDPACAGWIAPAPRGMHVAQAGDTLWALAHEYRGAIAHHRYLDALIDLNDGVGVEIGQAVRLP